MKKKVLAIGALCVVVLLVAGAAYYMFGKFETSKPADYVSLVEAKKLSRVDLNVTEEETDPEFNIGEVDRILCEADSARRVGDMLYYVRTDLGKKTGEATVRLCRYDLHSELTETLCSERCATADTPYTATLMQCLTDGALIVNTKGARSEVSVYDYRAQAIKPLPAVTALTAREDAAVAADYRDGVLTWATRDDSYKTVRRIAMTDAKETTVLQSDEALFLRGMAQRGDTLYLCAFDAAEYEKSLRTNYYFHALPVKNGSLGERVISGASGSFFAEENGDLWYLKGKKLYLRAAGKKEEKCCSVKVRATKVRYTDVLLVFDDSVYIRCMEEDENGDQFPATYRVKIENGKTELLKN